MLDIKANYIYNWIKEEAAIDHSNGNAVINSKCDTPLDWDVLEDYILDALRAYKKGVKAPRF